MKILNRILRIRKNRILKRTLRHNNKNNNKAFIMRHLSNVHVGKSIPRRRYKNTNTVHTYVVHVEFDMFNEFNQLS